VGLLGLHEVWSPVALIIHENDVEPLVKDRDRTKIQTAYNALDCCVPRECSDILEQRLDPDTERIYRFCHRTQGPALAMSLRGVLIDEPARAAAIAAFEAIEEKASATITNLASEIWDGTTRRVGHCTDADGVDHRNHLWPHAVDDAMATCRRCGLSRLVPSKINCNSSPQIKHLLYDLLAVPLRRDNRTGQPSVIKEYLEAIRGEELKKGNMLVAEIAHQAAVGKSARKQLGYARSRVGADGRMRHSHGVNATETGRWTATHSPMWDGWNITQIADRLRHIVKADPGLELGYADLEQAESHIVAYDSGDEGYIRAHATGDVHTYVCRLMWPHLEWTGDLVVDRVLADEPPDFDPYHARRDYGKRFQHGGNMGRTPRGVARQIHCPLSEAEAAYGRMYGGWGHDGAFPGIKLRQRAVWAEIQRTGVTVSCLGRRRQFLGRTWSAETLREALAQLEQSPVADILNLGLLRVWDELDTRVNVWDTPHPDQPNRVWLLAQVHDAILFLYRPGDLATLRRVKELMEMPLLINGRVLTIPVEIAVGPTWNKAALTKVKL
jgi:DNA polymerase family A